MLMIIILCLVSTSGFVSCSLLGTIARCPILERWVTCEDNLCAPETCNDLGFPLNCPLDISTPTYSDSCTDRCRCIPNFVRNAFGVCMPVEACHDLPKAATSTSQLEQKTLVELPQNASCGGDFNATSGCGIYCGNLCSNFRNRDSISCIAVCLSNSCDCRPGFVFNDIIGQCVLPTDCSFPCNGDYYAVRSECASPCQPTCAQPDPGACTKNCAENACVCAQGYILDKEGGRCIRIENCPKNLGCDEDPNAVITECGSFCPPTCEQTNPKTCDVCVTGKCQCKDGFIMSEATRKCINKNDCERCKSEPC